MRALAPHEHRADAVVLVDAPPDAREVAVHRLVGSIQSPGFRDDDLENVRVRLASGTAFSLTIVSTS
jgi:hypothetical protein